MANRRKWCGFSGWRALDVGRAKYKHCMCGRRVKLLRPLVRSKGTYKGKYRAAILPRHKMPGGSSE